MTDDELRAVVREAIRRHLGTESLPSQAQMTVPSPPASGHAHSSFAKFPLRNVETGACMIEPGVQCNHCGFCLSYGH